MSLILDALRKSEAERQRGQAPGLFAQQAPRPSRRRDAGPARTAWLAGTLALAAATAGAAWWLATHAVPAPDGVAPQAAAVPATSALRTDPAPAAEPIADTPPPVPLPAPLSPLPAARPATPARPTATAPPPATFPATAGTAGEPAAATETTPPDAAATLPRLADLPASERGALPPLRLSMHVFSADPAQRFVILDGRRLGEGGSPAPGVVVEAIHRDGLVLGVQDRAYWLGR